MNSLRTSLALNLPLLAPLLLLASLAPSSAGYASKKCDYSAMDDAMLQLPHIRVYEESMRRVGAGIQFRACTKTQSTALVKFDCLDQAVYISQSTGDWDPKAAWLPRHAVSQLCDLYGS
jgi:hypothetical protein